MRFKGAREGAAALNTKTESPATQPAIANSRTETRRSMGDWGRKVTTMMSQQAMKEALMNTELTGDELDFVRKVDDATTTAVIRARIAGHPLLQALHIDVDTRDAVVTLEGQVRTLQEKRIAASLANSVRDVLAVCNHLQVNAQAALTTAARASAEQGDQGEER